MNKRLREFYSHIYLGTVLLVSACVPDARLTRLPPIDPNLHSGGTSGSSGTSDSSGSSGSSSSSSGSSGTSASSESSTSGSSGTSSQTTTTGESGGPVRENFNQTFAYAKYDVLWVIDNSGSMVAEAAYVRNYINTFVDAVNARRIIDYRMAVTNTDWLDLNWGHGQLRGSVPIIDKSHADPIGEFHNAIEDIHMCATQACSPTEGYEMGLNSARQALTDNASTFIRPQSNLIVVVVSDEEDYSCTVDPNDATKKCALQATTRPETTPGWNYTPVSEFVSFFQNVKPAGTGGVAYFPIVGRVKTDCSTIATVGARYLSVLDGLGVGGGASGSICQNAMESGLASVANAIADNGVCFHLASVPQVSSIEVKVNNAVQAGGYTFDSPSNSVCFDLNSIPANGSAISITYYRQ